MKRSNAKPTIGWQSVDRVVKANLLIEQAVEFLEQSDFAVTTTNPGHYILKRPGVAWKAELKSIFGRDLEGMPLTLSLSEADEGLFLQLRYDTFAAFDTGDLERFADNLAAQIAALE